MFPLQNWQLPHMVKNVNGSRTRKMLAFVQKKKLDKVHIFCVVDDDDDDDVTS